MTEVLEGEDGATQVKVGVNMGSFATKNADQDTGKLVTTATWTVPVAMVTGVLRVADGKGPGGGDTLAAKIRVFTIRPPTA